MLKVLCNCGCESCLILKDRELIALAADGRRASVPISGDLAGQLISDLEAYRLTGSGLAEKRGDGSQYAVLVPATGQLEVHEGRDAVSVHLRDGLEEDLPRIFSGFYR